MEGEELLSLHVFDYPRANMKLENLVTRASSIVPPPSPPHIRHVCHEHFGLTSDSMDSLTHEEPPQCKDFVETFFDTPNRELLSKNCWLRCREYLEEGQIVWSLKREVSFSLSVFSSHRSPRGDRVD